MTETSVNCINTITIPFAMRIPSVVCPMSGRRFTRLSLASNFIVYDVTIPTTATWTMRSAIFRYSFLAFCLLSSSVLGSDHGPTYEMG